MSYRKTKVKSFYFDMDYLSQYWGVTGFERKYVNQKKESASVDVTLS